MRFYLFRPVVDRLEGARLCDVEHNHHRIAILVIQRQKRPKLLLPRRVPKVHLYWLPLTVLHLVSVKAGSKGIGCLLGKRPMQNLEDAGLSDVCVGRGVLVSPRSMTLGFFLMIISDSNGGTAKQRDPQLPRLVLLPNMVPVQNAPQCPRTLLHPRRFLYRDGSGATGDVQQDPRIRSDVREQRGLPVENQPQAVLNPFGNREGHAAAHRARLHRGERLHQPPQIHRLRQPRPARRKNHRFQQGQQGVHALRDKFKHEPQHQLLRSTP